MSDSTLQHKQMNAADLISFLGSYAIKLGNDRSRQSKKHDIPIFSLRATVHNPKNVPQICGLSAVRGH